MNRKFVYFFLIFSIFVVVLFSFFAEGVGIGVSPEKLKIKIGENDYFYIFNPNSFNMDYIIKTDSSNISFDFDKKTGTITKKESEKIKIKAISKNIKKGLYEELVIIETSADKKGITPAVSLKVLVDVDEDVVEKEKDENDITSNENNTEIKKPVQNNDYKKKTDKNNIEISTRKLPKENKNKINNNSNNENNITNSETGSGLFLKIGALVLGVILVLVGFIVFKIIKKMKGWVERGWWWETNMLTSLDEWYLLSPLKPPIINLGLCR